MKRHEWYAAHLEDAAAGLPGRRATPETGVRDLLVLRSAARAFGQRLDRSSTEDQPTVYASWEALLSALDPTRQLGTVARKRIDCAHDVQLAGAIVACEPVVFSRLGVPLGGMVTTWTSTTRLPATTPGVAVLDGVRTRTHILYALVGGERDYAYSLPILIEPARNPTDVAQLALQALAVAERGRSIVRRYAARVGHTRIGGLPILASTVRAAQLQRTGSVFGPPVAFGDLPELVDALDGLRGRGVPVVACCCLGRAGGLEAPRGWRIEESPAAAGGDAERPGAPAGLGCRVTRNVAEALLGRGPAAAPVLDRLPDAPGKTRVTRGTLVAQGMRGPARFRGLSYVSPAGNAWLALTNIDVTRSSGLARLSLAVEGLFGSQQQRDACRRRVAEFNARVEIPSNSQGAARRLTGIVVMAYAPTVVDRVGGIQH